MKMDFLKNKWTWIIAGAVLGISLLVWFGYSWGKSKGFFTIPGDSETQPLTADEKTEITNLYERLAADIYSLAGAFWRDSEAYSRLESASDRVFIGVANLYKQEKGESLFKAISGEISLNPVLVDTTRKIIERAKNLKIE